MSVYGCVRHNIRLFVCTPDPPKCLYIRMYIPLTKASQPNTGASYSYNEDQIT